MKNGRVAYLFLVLAYLSRSPISEHHPNSICLRFRPVNQYLEPNPTYLLTACLGGRVAHQKVVTGQRMRLFRFA